MEDFNNIQGATENEAGMPNSAVDTPSSPCILKRAHAGLVREVPNPLLLLLLD